MRAGTMVPSSARKLTISGVIHGNDAQSAVGDVVTVIGSDGAGEITLDEFAGWADTISYEILVGLGARLPRQYAAP